MLCHPDQPTETDIKLVDGVFIKRMVFKRVGMVVPQHAHSYDHLSTCAGGSAAVQADGVSMGILRAGDVIVIRAGVKHLFTTLEPNTVILCIHNTERTGEVEVFDEHHLAFAGSV